jgi:hypothetical protein
MFYEIATEGKLSGELLTELLGKKKHGKFLSLGDLQI